MGCLIFQSLALKQKKKTETNLLYYFPFSAAILTQPLHLHNTICSEIQTFNNWILFRRHPPPAQHSAPEVGGGGGEGALKN